MESSAVASRTSLPSIIIMTLHVIWRLMDVMYMYKERKYSWFILGASLPIIILLIIIIIILVYI